MQKFLACLLLLASQAVAGYDPLGLDNATASVSSSRRTIHGYDPLGLIQPVKPAPPGASGYSPLDIPEPEPESPPEDSQVLITVDGVDYPLEEILAEYKTTWTWPKSDGSYGGNDEASIRKHLSDPRHAVTGIANLDFETLKKVHSVLHQREEALEATRSKPKAQVKPAPQRPVQAKPRVAGPCPGGVCPQPQRSKPVGPVRGLLRGLFG